MPAVTDEFAHVKSIPTRMNLRKRYPPALRVIVVRSYWAVLAALIAVGGYVYSLGTEVPAEPVAARGFENAMQVILSYVAIGACAVLILKLAYEFLYHITYSYLIELEHLTITKGVFFRTRASFPIGRINDVSLKRNFIEMIFRVFSLDVLTASPEGQYGIIEGLNKKRAVDLQNFLLSLVETTLPDVKEKAAQRAMNPHLTHEERDAVVHGQVVNK